MRVLFWSALLAVALGGLSAQAQSWGPSTASTQSWVAVSCSANGTKILAAAEDGRLLLSATGGQKWTAGTGVTQAWSSVCLASASSRAVAAGKSGIAYSSDSGASWQMADAPTNAQWLSVAGSADGSLWLAAAAHSGLYSSSDSGQSWQMTSAPTNLGWSAVSSSADGSHLLAAVEPGLLYTSTDAGQSWAASNVPLLSWHAVASSADGTNLVAATLYSGLFISSDGGQTWNCSSAPTNDSWWSVASSADGTNLVAAGYSGGIYSSSDAGRSWTRNGALTNHFLSLCSSADGSTRAAAVYNGGIWMPGLANAAAGIAGTYQGLFFETNALSQDRSGFFSATINSRSNFSAYIQLAGRKYSWSGAVPVSGSVTSSMVRGAGALQICFRLTNNNTELLGSVSSNQWSAQLQADRAAYSKASPAPQAGNKYTLVLPGTNALSPAIGAGFATLSINKLGQLSLKASLADGSSFSQSSFLSARQQWPLFSSLYSGKGSLLGWLTLTNLPDRQVDGALAWFRPATQTKAKLYAGGFTNEVQAIGSLYQYTNHVGLLSLKTGLVVFAQADGLGGFTNRITWTTNNSVANLSSNSLTLKVTTSTGGLSGTAKEPLSGKSLSFKGVVLQAQNRAWGYFLGNNQSAAVLVEPAP